MKHLTIFIIAIVIIQFTTSLKLKVKLRQGDILAKADNIPNNEDPKSTLKSLESLHYINLINNGPNDNYSTNKIPSRKPWESTDTDVKTIWKKIRFDPKTLMVNTADFTYSVSTGKSSQSKINSGRVPYATAFGCEGLNIDDAKARIDLRGTHYAVDDTFSFGGWTPKGTLKLSFNNQVLELTGGGYCGYIAPKSAHISGEDEVRKGGWHLKLKIIDPELFFDASGNSYINLFNENYSSYKNPNRSPWGPDNSDIVTIWSKIRFDPVKLTINTSDYTYSTSKGNVNHWPNYNTKVPYGTAFGCEQVGIADSKSKIDLRGTKYAVDDTWLAGGYVPAGKATISQNGQVVDIIGGGYCGWVGPATAADLGEERLHQGGWDIKLKILKSQNDV